MDAAHFNALSGALSGDLAHALRHISACVDASGVVLQAAGAHFCIGANPHERHERRERRFPSVRVCCIIRISGVRFKSPVVTYGSFLR